MKLSHITILHTTIYLYVKNKYKRQNIGDKDKRKVINDEVP